MEITSGRANFQSGADSNLARPSDEAKTEGGRRILVWLMSPYEQ